MLFDFEVFLNRGCKLQLLRLKRYRDQTRARYFDFAVTLHDVDELVELFGIACRFQGESFDGAIHGAGTENFGFLQDRSAVLHVRPDAEKHQFATYGGRFGEIGRLKDVDELVHLFDELLPLRRLDIYDDAHARKLGIEGTRDREALNVVTAS